MTTIMRGWRRGRTRREGPIIPPEVVARRAERAGSAELALSAQAGYGLGLLLLRGLIDQRQHDAGLDFGRVWGRWALLAGLPSHQLRLPNGQGRPEVCDEAWIGINGEYRAACAALRDTHPARLVWAAVEMAVMDDDVTPILEGRTSPQGVMALRSGLDALARHFHSVDGDGDANGDCDPAPPG